jgi:hypothetical protein
MSQNEMNRQNTRSMIDPNVAPAEKEEQIRVDGFGQVLALLRVADPAFRESLLRRLAQRDPELARNLIRNLGRN